MGGLIALCLILWGIFSWLAPSVMVKITDGLGMESACVRYSISVYKKSGEIDDLAVVVERGFLAEKYNISAEYGQELLAREDFTDFVNAKQETGYEQTACGITAVSLYYTGKSDDALRIACSYSEGVFPKNGGLSMLLSVAVSNVNGKDFVREIREAIENIELDPQDVEGIANRDEALAVCDAFLN